MWIAPKIYVKDDKVNTNDLLWMLLNKSAALCDF